MRTAARCACRRADAFPCPRRSRTPSSNAWPACSARSSPRSSPRTTVPRSARCAPTRRKITPPALKSLLPLELEPVPWSDEAFLIASGSDDMRPGKHPYHAGGTVLPPGAVRVSRPWSCSIRSRASACSTSLPHPAARPTHIAARMQALEAARMRAQANLLPHAKGPGLLVANEIHPRRAWDLAENLERFGTRNTAISNETPRAPGRLFRRVVRRGAGRCALFGRGHVPQERGRAAGMGARAGDGLRAAPGGHPGSCAPVWCAPAGGSSIPPAPLRRRKMRRPWRASWHRSSRFRAGRAGAKAGFLAGEARLGVARAADGRNSRAACGYGRN